MATEKLNSRRTAWRYIGYGLLGALGLGLILLVILMFIPTQDAPVVCADCGTVWTDTVKKGQMRVQVRGLGTIKLAPEKSAATSVIEIRESEAAAVKRNQTAEVDTRAGIVPGHVSAIEGAAVNGVRKVAITLDGALPDGVTDGTQVNGTITIDTLRNVVYIGRPVHGEPNSSDTIFRVTADGHDAYRVKVKFGRASVNAIQILAGLNVGDKVILSDMSSWDAVDHVQMR